MAGEREAAVELDAQMARSRLLEEQAGKAAEVTKLSRAAKAAAPAEVAKLARVLPTSAGRDAACTVDEGGPKQSMRSKLDEVLEELGIKTSTAALRIFQKVLHCV